MESSVQRNAAKKEICILDADGNGVDRRALLFHISGDGLTKGVMTILEIEVSSLTVKEEASIFPFPLQPKCPTSNTF